VTAVTRGIDRFAVAYDGRRCRADRGGHMVTHPSGTVGMMRFQSHRLFETDGPGFWRPILDDAVAASERAFGPVGLEFAGSPRPPERPRAIVGTRHVPWRRELPSA